MRMKNLIFNIKIKMLRIMAFWSDCEIKMLQNVVFRLNSEIRLSWN